MAYLTYMDYQMYGGTLDEAAFFRHEFRARQLIDQMTHRRISGETPVREAIKRAMVEVIDAQARDAAHDGREVQAVSNDGISVTYAVPGAGDVRVRYTGIIYDYLANEVTPNGVPLLYAGVDA